MMRQREGKKCLGVNGGEVRRGTREEKQKKKEFQEINIKAKTLSMFIRKNIHLQGYEMQPLCKQWKALH